MDKELLVLSVVDNEPEISQRELANQTGLSLGTINILIKKMVREGLIKLDKLPAERAVYMLTAKGLEEKVNKTRVYLSNHYQAIEQMRQQLMHLVKNEIRPGAQLALAIQQPELNELMRQVLQSQSIGYADFRGDHDPRLTVLADYDDTLWETGNWINLHNHLKL